MTSGLSEGFRQLHHPLEYSDAGTFLRAFGLAHINIGNSSSIPVARSRKEHIDEEHQEGQAKVRESEPETFVIHSIA